MESFQINNDILKEWIEFREDKLSTLTEEDKKHFICFEEIETEILTSIPDENRNFVKNQLSKLDNNFMDYNYHWNEKYYRYGFSDGIKLICNCIDK